MKLLKAFLLLTRGKQIGVAVCLFHLVTVISLLGHHLLSSRLRPPRPMVVRTLLSTPPRPVPITQTAPPSVKKPTTPAPKPPPVAAAPKPKPAPPAKKTTASKPSIAVKKELPKLEPDPVLKEMAESFQAFKAEAQKAPERKAITLPAAIQRKPQTPMPQVISNEDPTYSEFLIAYLQTALDLPEYGEVRARIEIDRFGKLVNITIIEAKSAKNAEFLKSELPLLDFPSGITDSSQTFTITFRNI